MTAGRHGHSLKIPLEIPVLSWQTFEILQIVSEESDQKIDQEDKVKPGACGHDEGGNVSQDDVGLPSAEGWVETRGYRGCTDV